MTDASLHSELRSYYDTNGIAALGFRCPRKPDCSGGALRFTGAQESYVGPDYAASTPRLVFLSLDSGSAVTDQTTKTLEKVRERILNDDVEALPKGRHWYETHLLALTLLRPFHPFLTLSRVNRLFAHVNSAKCCLNNEGHAQADKRLFINCRPYIPGELRILKPNLLVTQGAYARDVADTFRVLSERPDRTCPSCHSKLVQIGQTQTLWFHTPHPRSFGDYSKQKRECWGHFQAAARAFFAGPPPSTTPRLRRSNA